MHVCIVKDILFCYLWMHVILFPLSTCVWWIEKRWSWKWKRSPPSHDHPDANHQYYANSADRWYQRLWLLIYWDFRHRSIDQTVLITHDISVHQQMISKIRSMDQTVLTHHPRYISSSTDDIKDRWLLMDWLVSPFHYATTFSMVSSAATLDQARIVHQYLPDRMQIASMWAFVFCFCHFNFFSDKKALSGNDC